MTSAAQIAANQANAQLSTGPATADGKAKASLNAVKTALTGRTVLLPAEDAAAYDQHIRAYQAELKPFGRQEFDLVQAIADAAWRLARIPGLEMAFYAKGCIQFAASFEDHEPCARAALIELETLVTYEKQLRNLQLQEARLHRRKEKDHAELRQLQEQRQQEDERKRLELLDAATRQFVIDRNDKKPFNSRVNGFEFSLDELEDHAGSKSSLWIDRVIRARDRAMS